MNDTQKAMKQILKQILTGKNREDVEEDFPDEEGEEGDFRDEE